MSTSTDENKRTVRAYTDEVFNARMPDRASDFVTPNVKSHDAQGTVQGVEDLVGTVATRTGRGSVPDHTNRVTLTHTAAPEAGIGASPSALRAAAGRVTTEETRAMADVNEALEDEDQGSQPAPPGRRYQTLRSADVQVIAAITGDRFVNHGRIGAGVPIGASGQVLGTPTLFIDGVVHRGGYDPPTLLAGLAR